MHDLIIIGGGPAGIAAGVYASRKKLRTVLLTESFGGQSIDSAEVQNWIGTIALSGVELAKNLEAHLRAYAGESVVIETPERVSGVVKKNEGFAVSTRSGKSFDARAILIASGAYRRKLDVPGAATFDNKGLTYCASCDGPLFSGMDVAVVGGGNAGFETASQLLAYCKSVTLLTHGDRFRADPVTVEKVSAYPNMRCTKNAEILEVKGDTFVTGLVYKDKESGEKHELSVSGIFVEIGLLPNTDFVKGLVELDQAGRVVVDPKNQTTSIPGIWAAGDCTNELYHQNNIAAGDAVKALEDIYIALRVR